MVSARVSPFAMELASTLSMERKSPPRRAIAAANDIRVRVLGSKKRRPSNFPSSAEGS